MPIVREFALDFRSHVTAMGVVIASRRRSNPESAGESGLLRRSAPRNDALNTKAQSPVRPSACPGMTLERAVPTRALMLRRRRRRRLEACMGRPSAPHKSLHQSDVRQSRALTVPVGTFERSKVPKTRE
jgi:hypothetical protein